MMSFRFNILADFYWESKIDKVLDTLSETGYRRFFSEQYYGSTLNGITVLLICQDPSLNLKQRIRLSKKEKTIYMDIMLDLNQFLKIEQKEREKIVVEKLINEVPVIIKKYRLEDFDILKFESDLKKWMIKIL
ncbi:hypothetical protein [Sphingobacterium anhuiense]|uniref:Uncharacterized protein n=1 Tax=Sphingobacterium anhuiense TaxID=493780 RepID=A0ABW5YTM9_9SPHI